MRLTALVVVAVLLVPGTAFAAADATGYLGDQCTELRKNNGDTFDVASCLNYVTGIVDILHVFRKMKKGDSFVPMCIPNNVNAKQLGLIVAKWVDENPKERHNHRAVGVVMALREAFPCKD